MKRSIHKTVLAVAAVILASAPAWAQSTSPSAGSTPNPGTAGSGTSSSGSSSNPYWGTSPGSNRGSSISSPSLGTGSAGRSPSGFSSGSGMGLIGDVPGGSYRPRAGRYQVPRSSAASSVAYYSPRALAEAATLLPRRNPEDEPHPAEILLRVPSDAEVWFDGDKTRLKGTVRRYYSTPLLPYKSYTYELRVRWLKDGKPVEETHRVRVRADDRVTLEVPGRSESGKAASTQTR